MRNKKGTDDMGCAGHDAVKLSKLELQKFWCMGIRRKHFKVSFNTPLL